MSGEVVQHVAKAHVDPPGRSHRHRNVGKTRADRVGSRSARKIVTMAERLLDRTLAARCTESSRLKLERLEEAAADQALPALTKPCLEHRASDHITVVRVCGRR